MTSIEPKTQERLDWLAARGIVLAVAYGPCRGAPGQWHVWVLNFPTKEHTAPLPADNFDHAVEVGMWHAIELEFVREPVP